MPNTPPSPKPATPDMAVLVRQLCCISLMNFIVFACALATSVCFATKVKTLWPGCLLRVEGLHGPSVRRWDRWGQRCRRRRRACPVGHLPCRGSS